jgi:hypothetical protein
MRDAGDATVEKGFKAHWLAETLRLRESLWGPLEDASEVRKARASPSGFSEKLLLRAGYLAAREKLDLVLEKWASASRLTLLGLMLAGLLAGIGAALGALGDGTRSVNVLLALVALLGINALAYLFWLSSFFIRSDHAGSWLGDVWLWLTRKLARGPDAALAPRALAELLSRQGALRWVLGAVSHAVWALAFVGALACMLALLSARRYGFSWETTLLSPDTFVWLTAALGWLPSLLGFPTPPAEIVRASDGLQTLPDSAMALWSGWLIGCVVVYGLLPRLLGLAVSLYIAGRRLRALTLDTTLPGYAELRDRLDPSSETTGIDAAATDGYQSTLHALDVAAPQTVDRAILGIELPADISWPPAALPEGVSDLGVIDGRSHRHQVLERLQRGNAGRLLLVCDMSQTPDRGTISLLSELGSLAQQPHVALLRPVLSDDRAHARAAVWQEKLTQAGFPADAVHEDLAEGVRWLGVADGEATTPAGGPHVQS